MIDGKLTMMSSADGITTTASKIESLIFTQEESDTCFFFSVRTSMEMSMVIHISGSIALIQMYYI